MAASDPAYYMQLLIADYVFSHTRVNSYIRRERGTGKRGEVLAHTPKPIF